MNSAKASAVMCALWKVMERNMKTRKILAALLLAAPLLLAFAAGAQDPGVQATGKSTIPLRVQVTFAEFDGDKKVGSLPYMLNQNADVTRETRTSLRMGIRVPILAKDNQVQYQNVGTDIDCYVRAQADGTFRATFELRRSSLYTPGPDTKQIEWKPNDPAMPGNPFFREFSGRFDALLRDGQSLQTTMATDPVSGRTLRVDVTLTVIK